MSELEKNFGRFIKDEMEGRGLKNKDIYPHVKKRDGKPIKGSYFSKLLGGDDPIPLRYVADILNFMDLKIYINGSSVREIPGKDLKKMKKVEKLVALVRELEKE